MPRYVLDGDVWQIVHIDKQLEITSGDTTTVRKFVTADQAAAQAAKLVDDKLSAGYRLVSDARHEALEAAIAEDPEAAESYAVYGDWLQAEGDPRGVLIAHMLHARLASASQQYIAKHAEQLLGPLARHAVRDGDIDVFEWRFGFIHRAFLREERVPVLVPLLAHPSGKFLVELRLETDDQQVIDALAQIAPASLRGLRITTRPSLDLSALWAVVPRLRRLAITGRALGLGELVLPELERLAVADDQLSAGNARMIARMPWPRLQQLRIDFGQGVLTGTASVDEVVDLLNRTDVPELRHVAVIHARQIGDLVKDIPASAVAPRLESLELTFANMTDTHALELARHAARLPKLAHLDVSGNRLTARGLEALRALVPTVRAASQLPP